MLRIYIPTLGRVGLLSQITLRQLVPHGIPCTLVCPPDEVEQHLAYHTDVIGCPAKGIGPTRQWIYENTPDPIMVVADDDMYFYRRDGVGGLDECGDITIALEWIEEQVKLGYLHGGLSARYTNKYQQFQFVDEWPNGKVNNFHYAVRGLPARWDRLPVMEDYHWTLSLITQGFANNVNLEFCWNQRGSGEFGGCSGYRTTQMQSDAAFELARQFPQWVKVIEKKAKGKGLFEGVRHDVEIQWRRAAEASGATVRPAN